MGAARVLRFHQPSGKGAELLVQSNFAEKAHSPALLGSQELNNNRLYVLGFRRRSKSSASFPPALSSHRRACITRAAKTEAGRRRMRCRDHSTDCEEGSEAIYEPCCPLNSGSLLRSGLPHQ
jgi:hypothetical protein